MTCHPQFSLPGTGQRRDNQPMSRRFQFSLSTVTRSSALEVYREEDKSP
jgi:hypothetical protein